MLLEKSNIVRKLHLVFSGIILNKLIWFLKNFKILFINWLWQIKGNKIKLAFHILYIFFQIICSKIIEATYLYFANSWNLMQLFIKKRTQTQRINFSKATRMLPYLETGCYLIYYLHLKFIKYCYWCSYLYI